MLPRNDSSMCVRVLQDAEYFGIDSLLDESPVDIQTLTQDSLLQKLKTLYRLRPMLRSGEFCFTNF